MVKCTEDIYYEVVKGKISGAKLCLFGQIFAVGASSAHRRGARRLLFPDSKARVCVHVLGLVGSVGKVGVGNREAR